MEAPRIRLERIEPPRWLVALYWAVFTVGGLTIAAYVAFILSVLYSLL